MDNEIEGLIGDARVSTTDQELNLQIDAVLAHGVEREKMITLTLYFLIQRIYRAGVAEDASTKGHRTTTQTILRAFNTYMLIIHRTRLGRQVQPTRLTTRQRSILQRLGFDTPSQILSRRLPRAP